MDDESIIQLFLARDEQAIAEARAKYGGYCRRIARNILHSDRDAEECEAATYLAAWGAIPPQRPAVLSVFLGRIARNLALKRRREGLAEKRGGGQTPLCLDELEACIPDSRGLDDTVQARQLADTLNAFLRALPATERRLFIRRYWYGDSIADLCERFGFGQSKVKMTLLRTREKLRDHLTKEGVFV